MGRASWLRPHQACPACPSPSGLTGQRASLAGGRLSEHRPWRHGTHVAEAGVSASAGPVLWAAEGEGASFAAKAPGCQRWPRRSGVPHSLHRSSRSEPPAWCEVGQEASPEQPSSPGLRVALGRCPVGPWAWLEAGQACPRLLRKVWAWARHRAAAPWAPVRGLNSPLSEARTVTLPSSVQPREAWSPRSQRQGSVPMAAHPCHPARDSPLSPLCPQSLPLISASRWLLKRGELFMVEETGLFRKLSSRPTCYLFLFNDVLVVTKKKRWAPPVVARLHGLATGSRQQPWPWSRGGGLGPALESILPAGWPSGCPQTSAASGRPPVSLQ